MSFRIVERKYVSKLSAANHVKSGKLIRACVAGALAFSTGYASAALIGPTYPAPGGNSFSSSGSQISAAGATRSYGSFNTSAFSTLYWGSDSSSLPGAGLDGTAHTLSFSSTSGTTATWLGTTSWFNHNTNTNNTNVSVEMLIDIGGLGATPWVTASSLGLNSNLGALVDLSSGQNFTANVKFLANVGNGFQSLDSIDASGLVKASLNGAFYYSDPNGSTAGVPEPGTTGLLAIGALAVASLRRRIARA